jgi:Lon protease-like protein
VNCAVAQRFRERIVDAAVLVEQRQPAETRRGDDHLEVVAAARAVLDPQLLRVGKRILQQRFEAFDGHRFQRTLWPVAEIGLFPLGIVLLPTEQVPLHIFEPRYRELVGECIEQDVEFGVLYADEEGIRETGTRTTVAAVLERFDDGRLNIVVVGGQRFTVERMTHGRSFMTAETSDVDDEPSDVDDATRAAALGAFRALAALADVEVELDEGSPELSFQLAAQVELAPDEKQFLLESLSEQERLERVAELLDNARRTLIATRDLNEKAKRNGHR